MSSAVGAYPAELGSLLYLGEPCRALIANALQMKFPIQIFIAIGILFGLVQVGTLSTWMDNREMIY